MSRSYIGVDIGGTKVAAGIVSESGEVGFKTRIPMSARGTADGGLNAVLTAIRHSTGAVGASEIGGIGICSPGPLDPRTGVVINPPNLPCWRNFPLADKVREAFGVPTWVDNDANAAALAEAKWGAGRGYQNVFYATVGTGIGTGIVFNGEIYHGRTGAAGEGGHMSIDINGPRCGCGKPGCIEVLASGPAIADRARRMLATSDSGQQSLLLKLAGDNIDAITGEIVGKAFAAGDQIAAAVLQETVACLALWVGNVIDLLEPDVIIFGGGVSSMLGPLLGDIHKRLPQCCLNPCPTGIPLVRARYGEDAGVAGAAALCTVGQMKGAAGK